MSVPRTPAPNAGQPSAAGRTVPLRWRIVKAVQVVVALALIALVLSQVRISDTLVMPPGGPLAGEHRGRIVREDGRLVFERNGVFRLEAVVENGAIREAALVYTDGRREALEGARLAGLEPPEEGLISIVRRIDPALYLAALFVHVLAYACAITRWKLFLDAAGLPTRLPTAARLSCIGLFFNNVVPGLTGGDLVKAYYIAREHRDNKTDAVITVVVDRVMGITVLAAFSAAAVLTDLERYQEIALSIWGFLLAVLASLSVFYSHALRRLFAIDPILDALPFKDFVRKVDRSAFLYRSRKGTILAGAFLTAGVHLSVILALWTAGKAFALDLSLVTYAVVIPLALIVSALPVTPAGWGVGEWSFVYFFGFAGVEPVLALALSFIYRFNTLLISLSGGAVLVAGGRALAAAEGAAAKEVPTP